MSIDRGYGQGGEQTRLSIDRAPAEVRRHGVAGHVAPGVVPARSALPSWAGDGQRPQACLRPHAGQRVHAARVVKRVPARTQALGRQWRGREQSLVRVLAALGVLAWPVSGSAAQAPPQAPHMRPAAVQDWRQKEGRRTWVLAAAATRPPSTLPGAPTGPVSRLALAPHDLLTHTRKPGTQAMARQRLVDTSQRSSKPTLMLQCTCASAAQGTHRRAGPTPAHARPRPRRRSPRARCSPGRRLPRARPASPASPPAHATAPCWYCAGEAPHSTRTSGADLPGAGKQSDGGLRSAQTAVCGPHPSSSWRSGRR
jgi:hypothetical protein